MNKQMHSGSTHLYRWIIRTCLFALILGLLLSQTISLASESDESPIRGIVVDKNSEQPLAGVTVKTGSGASVETDSDGKFQISAANESSVALTFQKEGYSSSQERIRKASAGEELRIKLSRIMVFKESVTIEGAVIPEVQPVDVVPAEFVQKVPGAGEDALQSIKYMPGVSGGDDWSSRLYVRGGRPDQNGIFLDGIPVFDPYRLFGLTSLFNPEMLKNIKLYPGGFDVQYGDRLSAVIEVDNRPGVLNKSFTGSANVSMTNTNLVAEGKLKLGFPASWLWSFRRTYYDLLMRYADDSDSEFPSFFDSQAVIYLQPYPQHTWMLTLLAGNEGTDIIEDEEVISEEAKDHIELADDQKNYIVGLNGSHVFGEIAHLSYTASWTENNQRSDAFLVEGDTQYESSFTQNLQTRVSSLRQNLELLLPPHTLLAGFDLAQSQNTVRFDIGTEDPDIDIPDYLLHFSETQNFMKYGVFLQNTWEIIRDLEWKAGARWDKSTLSDMSVVSPRSSLRWRMKDQWDMRLAWGYYYQFPSYELLQAEGYFLDFRSIKDLHLKPEKAIHYLMGTSYESPQGYEVSVDLYYKQLFNLLQSGWEDTSIDVLNEQNQVEPYEWETMTFIPENARDGYARGTDISFTLMEGHGRPYYGTITYTFSQSKSHDDRGWHYDSWDQRHSVTLISGWKFNKAWEVGVKWRFASGFPYTPLTKVIRVVHDSDGDTYFEPENGETFSYRRDDPDEKLRSGTLPPYHRLDFRVQYSHRFDRIDADFYIDVINAYNRTNVSDYYYNDDYTKRSEETGMPFLPSFGVRLRI